MGEIILTGIIGLVSTIVSGCVSWTLARKKYNSEVDHNLIENMEKSLDFYDKLSNDNIERLSLILEDNNKLRNDVLELLRENKQLKKEVNILKSQMIKLTTTICTDLSCLIRSKDYSIILSDNESEFDND